MLNADWKGLQFNGIKALTRESTIFMCTIANGDADSCKYAICQACEVQYKPRGRLCMACRDECRNECHHQIRNLVMTVAHYWCGKGYINGPKWEDKPQGCVCCKMKFVGNY